MVLVLAILPATALGDDLPTLEQFEQALTFESWLSGNELTGSRQAAFVLYTYSDGNVAIPSDKVEVRFTLPKGVTPHLPSSENVSFTTQTQGENTIVILK